MNFVAFSLLVLFVLVVILCFVKNARYQNLILLFVSYLFYAFWDWWFLGLLVLTTAVVYCTGLNIKKKFALFSGVSWPLLVLGIFKYYNFFVTSLSGLFSNLSSVTINIVVPLGISFYTFLAISYVLDVKSGKLEAEKDFIKLALYISFFPTVISGPITKARELLPQFAKQRVIAWENIKVGIQYIATGCMKKLVLADNMGVLVDEVYATPLAFDTYTVWLAVVTYSLQLYFDFSGYSDIARGISKCLGFEVAQNFNMPYLAKNLSEFWKRWHISLSSWLQEYLYIPLGGNRVGKIRSYTNLMIVMLLCGLWHGASWNFVLWGGTHGLLLCLQRIYNNLFGNKLHLPDVVKVCSTFLLATLCWIPFRGTDVENISQIFRRLFIVETFAVNHMYVWAWVGIVAFVVAALLCIYRHSWQGYMPLWDITFWWGSFAFYMEIFFILGLFYTGNNPFVYARF